MRVPYPHPIGPFLLSLLLVLPQPAPGASCAAQALEKTSDQAPLAQTTLVMLNDRPLPDGLWPALVAALREELASGSPETRALAGNAPSQGNAQSGKPEAGADPSLQIQIVREDTIPPGGLLVNQAIIIYLHGECRIVPRPRPFFFEAAQVSPGVLGWVRRDHGQIESFAHVECSRIAEMLATHASVLNSDQRNRMMAVAMARVIVHEWIHIATQNSHHSEHGLGKAQFGVADLLEQPAKPDVHRNARLNEHPGSPLAGVFEADLENPQAPIPAQGCD